MQISITEDEIKAIDFGLEQIREALEGSSDDDYKSVQMKQLISWRAFQGNTI